MPIRDDLILRMLDRIGAVVARVLTGTAPDDLEAAERELATAYVELTGSGRALVGRLSSEQLLAILGAPGSFNRERGYVLARLLEADAALGEIEAGREAAGDAGAAAEGSAAERGAVGAGVAGAEDAPAARSRTSDSRRLKALDLYLEASRAGLDEEDLEERIRGLEVALAGLALPQASHWRVFEHVVANGRYADAEDMLFDAVERFGPAPEVASRGRAFYRDLEAMPDADLEEGALPREEVAEGRTAFEAELGRTARPVGEEPR